MKASAVRKHHIIRADGTLFRVLKMDHVTPGKGKAHVQLKLRNLLDGAQGEMRLRTDENIEQVTLETRTMQFLYRDQGGFHFMDTSSYEQAALGEELLGESALYLLPETEVLVQWFEGRPLGIDLPSTVELEVTETAPGIKDATASAQRKPATLETGLVIQVPAFIENGEKIRVNTLDGSYSERVR